jgi:hypothetical protein
LSTGGNPVYQIIGGGGTFNDGTQSGIIDLLPTNAAPFDIVISPTGYFTYDDLVAPLDGEGQILDNNGLLFNFGGIELDIYGNIIIGSGNDTWYENNGANGSGTFDLTETGSIDTPEPGSLLLLGTGLLALSIAQLRKPKPAMASRS